MKNKRLTKDARRDQLMAAALLLAANTRYDRITRNQIAEAAGVVGSLVQHYFGTMPQLRRSIMRAAVDQEVLHVIAQGLVDRDPQALKAPDQLKSLAISKIGVDGMT